MGFLKKIVNWIRLNIVSVLGIAQAVVKFVKEVLTAIVNILFPIIPNAKFQAIVMAVRNVVNKIDEWIEKIKSWILPVVA